MADGTFNDGNTKMTTILCLLKYLSIDLSILLQYLSNCNVDCVWRFFTPMCTGQAVTWCFRRSSTAQQSRPQTRTQWNGKDILQFFSWLNSQHERFWTTVHGQEVINSYTEIASKSTIYSWVTPASHFAYYHHACKKVMSLSHVPFFSSLKTTTANDRRSYILVLPL